MIRSICRVNGGAIEIASGDIIDGKSDIKIEVPGPPMCQSLGRTNIRINRGAFSADHSRRKRSSVQQVSDRVGASGAHPVHEMSGDADRQGFIFEKSVSESDSWANVDNRLRIDFIVVAKAEIQLRARD